MKTNKTTRTRIAAYGSTVLAALALAGALLFTAASVIQSSEQLEVQLKAATHKELVDGDLQGAIAEYKSILARAGTNRTIASKALLQMGKCYERLGVEEAQKAYEQLLRDYSDQKEDAAEARLRLKAMQAVVDRKDHGPTIRQIWSGPEADTCGAPSPDGKYLSFVDWSTGDLAVRDLKTGKNRRLTDKGPWEKSSDEAESSIWSPDGNQIAFEWLCAGGNYDELRVMGLSGSQPRTLYRAGKGEWASLYDWSPDGKQILASIPGEKLALISVADGSIRILKTLSRDPSKAKLSPDGRYIIYDTPQSTDSLDRDIHVMSIEASRDRLLVSHAADDSILGWTPDGKFILFLSDRTGSPCFWLLPMADGKPEGSPQLIRTASRNTKSLGFSRDGRFFYGESKSVSDVYTVNLNPATGKVLGPPEKIIDRFEGFNFSPSYSPDGRYLAYSSQRDRSLHPTQGGNVLCIHSMDSGEDKEFSKGLRKLGVGYISKLRWAPDGKSIVIYGLAMTVGDSGGTYVVDLQTEVVTKVLYSGNDFRFGGADGKSIIFSRFDKKKSLRYLVMRNLETENEKILYELPESANPDWQVSPDFQQLCLLIGEQGKRVFRIMRSSGGEPRILREFSEQERPTWFTWAADGKYILFMKRDKSAEKQLWRLSIDTGEPELLGLMPSNYRGDLSAHPDGKRIAFSGGSWSGTPEIWMMEDFLPK
jgi:Tol biopolymer transport system component